jgi:hypothetical protein
MPREPWAPPAGPSAPVPPTWGAASSSGQWVLPPPPTKRKVWLIVLAILGALVLLGGISAAIIGVAVQHQNDRDIKAAKATCEGFDFTGHRNRDHCAALGGEVRDFGQTITASNLKRVPASATAPARICADVSYLNRGGGDKAFSEYDWFLGDAGGTLHDSDADASSLGEGQITPRGRTSGTVCFEDNVGRGQLALIWDPDEFRGDRGVWLGSLF